MAHRLVLFWFYKTSSRLVMLSCGSREVIQLLICCYCPIETDRSVFPRCSRICHRKSFWQGVYDCCELRRFRGTNESL